MLRMISDEDYVTINEGKVSVNFRAIPMEFTNCLLFNMRSMLHLGWYSYGEV